ncbi:MULTISPECIES: hypothetical protein [unclassified Microcoleus]|uniref:hypothetical protein n=1 Tax=unclassified Microcoleus TaxID=2642155 RepID=UPI002FCF7935
MKAKKAIVNFAAVSLLCAIPTIGLQFVGKAADAVNRSVTFTSTLNAEKSPVLLAQQLYGDIFDKWARLGGERSPLGNPTTDERPAAKGGRYNDFQHGFIYWRPNQGAYAVYGEIGKKWNSIGRERSAVGYPISDERSAANGGRYNQFEFGFIYWHPSRGAYAVYGDIAKKWDSMGREKSSLGYPISDELPSGSAGNRVSHFERGSIYWNKSGKITVSN